MSSTTINMKETAYHYLKNKILNCEILPGEDVKEKQIAEKLNTGRTPVREAIITLQNEGLVEVFPRKGTCATNISIEDTIELYQMRSLIEPAVAAQNKHLISPVELMKYDDIFKNIYTLHDSESDIAFYKADIDFHRYIINCAENTWLKRVFSDMMQATYRLGIYNSIQTDSNTKQEAYDEHSRIIEAILLQNNKQIIDAINTHINSSRVSSLRILNKLNSQNK